MSLIRINPEELPRSPYYSQATVVPAGVPLVFIGGQNAVDADGALVGDNESLQTEQVMANVVACLRAAGCDTTDLVSLEVKVVDGVDLTACQQVAARFLPTDAPPLVGVSVVSGLARPGALVEVSAVAAPADATESARQGRR